MVLTSETQHQLVRVLLSALLDFCQQASTHASLLIVQSAMNVQPFVFFGIDQRNKRGEACITPYVIR